MGGLVHPISVRAGMFLQLGMLAVCDLVLAHSAYAADISVSSLGNSETALITFQGDIVSSDARQFQQKTSTISKAIVVMHSDGGSLFAGIEVGKIIRLRNYTTLVPDNARCASACALAWLGGTSRYMAAKAQIGFHAAYNATSGQETGVGNALVGAYLSQIGLPDRAVVYVTQASPQSMTWLTISEAQEKGIDVALFTPSRDQQATAVADNMETMRRKSSEFILALYKKSNLVDASSVASWLSPLYEADVDYFGARKTKQIILDEKQKFFARWPQRDYQVRDGSMNINCDQAAGTCRVTGVVDWSVLSPARAAKASGAASFKFGLRLASAISIIEESSTVLRRDPAVMGEVARLPTIVQTAVLAELTKARCSNKVVSSKAVTQADLNGDGIPDFVIEFDAIRCNDNQDLAQASQNCGTGGCLTEIWLSEKGSWRIVSSGVLRRIKRGPPKGHQDTLVIETHGVSCDQPGYQSCFFKIWWTGEKFDRERIANFDTNAAETPAAESRAYSVQVAAQRTEHEAQSSYQVLQQKYPSLLAKRPPEIRRVDLGDKGGVFYRAHVGPFATPEQAISFCNSLKTAGGQCIVQHASSR